jgi:putative spermidine/putrescine transport system permease protein
MSTISPLTAHEPTLRTYAEFRAVNITIILRTVMMAAVALISAAIAFPRLLHGALCRVRAKAFFISRSCCRSGRLSGAGLCLEADPARKALTWIFGKIHMSWLIDGMLALLRLAVRRCRRPYRNLRGFSSIWLPFMILPIQAALERVPRSLLEASADLGAKPAETFRKVIVPLSIPGIAAGSIFTFSLTLGDYIIPNLVGSSRPFIGMVVYAQQGTAGNLPLAAAFAMVPVIVMAGYLALAKRFGAFDAL